MKKHTLRRFLALALSMLICFSLMSATAAAQSPDETTTNNIPTIRILTPVDTFDSSSGGSHAETPSGTSFEAAARSDHTALEETAPSGEKPAATETGVPDGDPIQNEEEPGGIPDETVPHENESDKADAPADSPEIKEETDGPAEDEDAPNTGRLEEDIKQPDEEEAKTDEIIPEEAAGEPGRLPDEAENNSGEIFDETAEPETPDGSAGKAPVRYGDGGVTEDGIRWEFTCDSTTGQYTLLFKLDKTSEDGQPAISEDTLTAMEAYTVQVSRELSEKYGMKWAWDSAAGPDGEEDVQKFQVFLTGENDHTYKYNSVSLEQMDGEFTLEKVDGETGRPITGSETSFHLWHVNEVIDSGSGEKMDVKMYCSYDADTHAYTFVPTESTIQTIGGKLEVLYAMMKDTVYYLQEASAPGGYEIDPGIHIVMEKDVWESKEESFRKDFDYIGEFTEEKDGRIGLDIKFEDIKTYSGHKGKIAASPVPAMPEPEVPSIPEEPVPPNPAPEIIPEPEKYDIPDPVPDIDPEPVPEPVPNVVTEPEAPTPAPVIPEPEPEPVTGSSGIPKTGDAADAYSFVLLISSAALAALAPAGRRKRIQK